MPAIAQPEPVCGAAGAAVDEGRQIDGRRLLDILAVFLRKGGVHTRMAFRTVGARDDPGLAHERDDVAFSHIERHELAASVAILNDPDRRRDRIDIPFCGDRIEPHTAPFMPRCDQQQRMRTAAPTHVLGHLVFDPAPLGGVLEPFQQSLAAAFLRPRREQCGLQAGARGFPRILVGGDILPSGPGAVDRLDDCARRAVGVDTQNLDMGNVDGEPGFTADGQHFLHRLLDADRIGRFVALVGVVGAAAYRCLARQRNDLVRIRKALRNVIQAGRQAERALAHALGHERFHFAQFPLVGSAAGLAQHGAAHWAEAHIGRDIGPEATRFHFIEEGSDLRRSAAVDAGENRGHSLHEPRQIQAAFPIAGFEETLGMGMRIDKARGDDHSAGIDDACIGGRIATGADINDFVPGDDHVADERRFRTSIVDRTARQNRRPRLRGPGGSTARQARGREEGKGCRNRSYHAHLSVLSALRTRVSSAVVPRFTRIRSGSSVGTMVMFLWWNRPSSSAA